MGGFGEYAVLRWTCASVALDQGAGTEEVAVVWKPEASGQGVESPILGVRAMQGPPSAALRQALQDSQLPLVGKEQSSTVKPSTYRDKLRGQWGTKKERYNEQQQAAEPPPKTKADSPGQRKSLPYVPSFRIALSSNRAPEETSIPKTTASVVRRQEAEVGNISGPKLPQKKVLNSHTLDVKQDLSPVSDGLMDSHSKLTTSDVLRGSTQAGPTEVPSMMSDEYSPPIEMSLTKLVEDLLSVVHVPPGKQIRDIKDNMVGQFILQDLMFQVDEYTAARVEIAQKKASAFQDKKELEREKAAAELSCLIIAGNGDLSEKNPDGLGPHLIDNHDAVERLSYFFSRGVGDAIARCQEKGRGVICLCNAHDTPLVARIASSLMPWRFANFAMIGMLEHDGEDSQQDSNAILERHIRHIVRCPETTCNTTTVHMCPSRKTQMAELLNRSYESHQVKMAADKRNAMQKQMQAELDRVKQQMDYGTSWEKKKIRFLLKYKKTKMETFTLLESLRWMMIILGAVIADISITVTTGDEQSVWKTNWNYFTTALFLFDVVFRVWCMGPRDYFCGCNFTSALCFTDFLLSVLDILTLAMQSFDSGGFASAGRALRGARLFRLLRLVRVFTNPDFQAFLKKKKTDDSAEPVNVPHVLLVVNGGDTAKVDCLQAVRKSWDIVVLAGTGGLADEINRAWRLKKQEADSREEEDEVSLRKGRRHCPTGDKDDLRAQFIDAQSFADHSGDTDPSVDEIVQFGRLNILQFDSDGVDDVTRMLTSLLVGTKAVSSKITDIEPTLQAAWKLYGELHETAKRERQKSSFVMQLYTFIGILTTVLIAVRAQLQAFDVMINVRFEVVSDQRETFGVCDSELNYTAYGEPITCSATRSCSVCPHENDLLLLSMIILPVLSATLQAMRSRFFHIGKYRSLVHAAETVKRHIYEYRSRTGKYSSEKFCNAKLSQTLLDVSIQLAKTEATSASFVNGDSSKMKWLFTSEGREDVLNISHKNDMALNPLVDINQYISIRLQDRQQYFLAQSRALQRWTAMFNTFIYGLNAVSTCLAAFGFFLWVALSMAQIDVFHAWLAEEQIEQRSVKFNEGYSQLTSIRDWWNSLAEGDQIKKINRNKLVESTESVIESIMASQFSSERDEDEEEEEGILEKESEADMLQIERRALKLRSTQSDVHGLRCKCGFCIGIQPNDEHADTAKETSKEPPAHLELPIPSTEQHPNDCVSHMKFLNKHSHKIATALAAPASTNAQQIPPSALYKFLLKDVLESLERNKTKTKKQLSVVVMAGTGAIISGDQSTAGEEAKQRRLGNLSGKVSQSLAKAGANLAGLLQKQRTNNIKKSWGEVIGTKLDHFLGRGLGEAISKTSAAQRGLVLVCGGRQTEVVKRITSAVKVWQIPSVFEVGVCPIAITGGQEGELRLDLSTLNPHHTRHIFLQQEGRRILPAFGQTTSSSGCSVLVDVAEMVGVCFHAITDTSSEYSVPLYRKLHAGSELRPDQFLSTDMPNFRFSPSNTRVRRVIQRIWTSTRSMRQLDLLFASIYPPSTRKERLPNWVDPRFSLNPHAPPSPQKDQLSQTPSDIVQQEAERAAELVKEFDDSFKQTKTRAVPLDIPAPFRMAHSGVRSMTSMRQSSMRLINPSRVSPQDLLPDRSSRETVVHGEADVPMKRPSGSSKEPSSIGRRSLSKGKDEPEDDRFGRSINKAMYGVTRGNLSNVTFLMLLINGGHSARSDVLHAVRKGWDIIVFAGSGGFADRLCHERQKRAEGQGSTVDAEGQVGKADTGGLSQLPFDAAIEEILSFGRINVIDLHEDSVEDVTSLCFSRLHGATGSQSHFMEDPVLFQAWQTYAMYNKTGKWLKKMHNSIEMVVMILELLTIVFLAADNEYDPKDCNPSCERTKYSLEILIATCPILVACAMAIKNHFNYGIKWIIIEGAAENMRGQIFRYRSRSGKYADPNLNAKRLAATMQRITRDVVKSECQNVSLKSLESHERTYRAPKIDYRSIRRLLFRIVLTKQWERIDMLLIVSSAICLTIGLTVVPRGQLDGMPFIKDVLISDYGINFFFALAFTVQLLCNILGFGPAQFWSQGWMKFDTFIVFMTWLGYAVDFGSLASMIRIIRLGRLGKLLSKSANSMDKKQRQKTLNLHHSDDALSMIDADDYVQFRLQKSVERYKKDRQFLYLQFTFFSLVTLALSATTTILGLLGHGVWLLVTMATSSLVHRYLELKQSELRMKAANETILKLESKIAWWNSLSSSERIKQTSLSRVVEDSEYAISYYISRSLSAMYPVLADDEDGDEQLEDSADNQQKKAKSKSKRKTGMRTSAANGKKRESGLAKVEKRKASIGANRVD